MKVGAQRNFVGSVENSSTVYEVERLLEDIVDTGKSLNTDARNATFEFDSRGARQVSRKQRRLLTTLLKIGATAAGGAAIAMAFKNNQMLRTEFKKILEASVKLLPDKVRSGTMALYTKVKAAFPFLTTWLPFVVPAPQARDNAPTSLPPGFTSRVWKLLAGASTTSASLVAKYLSNVAYWYAWPLVLVYQGGKAGKHLYAVFTDSRTGKEVAVDIDDLPPSVVEALLQFQKRVFQIKK